MVDVRLATPEDRLTDYCRRWKVAEMAIFGSALQEDFGPDSDIDIVVLFNADARWGLFDLVRMGKKLKALLGRPVDLVPRVTGSRARTTSGARGSSAGDDFPRRVVSPRFRSSMIGKAGSVQPRRKTPIVRRIRAG